MEQITGFVKTLGISGVITILMGIFYKIAENNKWVTSDAVKTWIVVGIGGAVGVFYLFYSGTICNLQTIADHILFGIKEGLAAIGMFKVGQAVGFFSPPGPTPPPK